MTQWVSSSSSTRTWVTRLPSKARVFTSSRRKTSVASASDSALNFSSRSTVTGMVDLLTRWVSRCLGGKRPRRLGEAENLLAVGGEQKSSIDRRIQRPGEQIQVFRHATRIEPFACFGCEHLAGA